MYLIVFKKLFMFFYISERDKSRIILLVLTVLAWCKEMVEAIARRNEIQRLERKLQSLDQEVSVASSKKRKPRQAALTTLIEELMVQVQTLVAEVTWMKRQFILQLDPNPITS